MRFKLLAALAAAAALAVAGCGSNQDTSSKSTSVQTSGNGADRAFVAAMIPHHQSAVQMAEIASQRGQSDFVRKLAEDIIRTQNAEITAMRGEDAALAKAGIKPSSLGMNEHAMGMDMDPSMLKTAKPFDAAFLKMMIPHHQGAVTMAKAELTKGADPELKRLAENIITAQQREISEMRAQGGTRSGSTGDTGAMGAMDDHSSH